MKTLSITFSRPLVPLILRDAKTQTRRVVKPQPPQDFTHAVTDCNGLTGWYDDGDPEYAEWWPEHSVIPSPYGLVGNHLWVREDYRLDGFSREDLDERVSRGVGLLVICHYLADGATREITLTPAETVKLADRKTDPKRPQPGRFMYRSCSRILLELTGIRVERLQEISGEDALAEGITIPRCGCEVCAHTATLCPADASAAIEEFRALWERINSPESWDANPWVWVLEFKRLEGER